MTFPQKLQEYRRSAKLSQEDLANKLGVSRQSLSKWEQGLSFPETEKLIELSSMMGLSIDCLLKDTDDLLNQPNQPESPEPDASDAVPPAPKPSFLQKHWLTLLLAVLLVLVSAALVITNLEPQDSPSSTETFPETTAPVETTIPIQTEPVETEPAPTETEPISTEPPFDNEDLRQLQSWFFDFARDYRLDYMPQFTEEEGAPTDSGEYLYWAYAINLDNWGEEKGKMTREYVDETVWQYFRVTPILHRSHHKQWNYDESTEVYTAWPDGLRSLPYYLLNSVEIDGNTYTIHATCYSCPYYMEPGPEDDRLRQTLLEGNNTELTPISEVTISFHLDYFSFYEPRFLSFTTSDIG